MGEIVGTLQCELGNNFPLQLHNTGDIEEDVSSIKLQVLPLEIQVELLYHRSQYLIMISFFSLLSFHFHQSYQAVLRFLHSKVVNERNLI